MLKSNIISKIIFIHFITIFLSLSFSKENISFKNILKKIFLRKLSDYEELPAVVDITLQLSINGVSLFTNYLLIGLCCNCDFVQDK